MNNTSSLENTVSPLRVLIFGGIALLIFIIYLVRLFSVQVLTYAQWAKDAEENRVTVLNVQAPRGIIYDRNGVVLAQNIASYNVVMTYAALPDDVGEIQRIFRELSAVIDVPVIGGELNSETNPYVECRSNHGIAQIAQYAEGSYPYSPVKIKCNVDPKVAMMVQEKEVDWPGITVQVEPVRDYPTGIVTADIIGYLGPINPDNEDFYTSQGFVANRDKVGYSGLEYALQDILGGRNGLRTVERDVGGRIIRDITQPANPVPGQNVRLTIDVRLQQAISVIVEDELNSWNKYFGKITMTSGVAIALNPKTGEILAMVSYPSYENNRMAREIPYTYYKQLEADETKPLLNHAVGDELPVGSVFKLVTAVGGLNEGIIDPNKIIQAPGKIVMTEHLSVNDPGKQREFVDWNWRTGGFGEIDFLRAVANSSNVYFYKIGGGYPPEVPEGLGVCRLSEYARAMGYGDYPGTNLPEEAKGNLPDPNAKRLQLGESWSIGDTYISSVGQGYVLGTPLQVLLSAATVANDGKLMVPTLVHDFLDGEGNVTQAFSPRMHWDLTTDKKINEFYPDTTIAGCEATGNTKNVEPWVFTKLKEGMRLAVTQGTLSNEAKIGFQQLNIAVAGKTGTAEYCDKFARANGNPCTPGNWPTHGWTLAFAPYENPEIAVVAFVYNGGEGASSAAPIVRRVMQAYFELKAIDNAATR